MMANVALTCRETQSEERAARFPGQCAAALLGLLVTYASGQVPIPIGGDCSPSANGRAPIVSYPRAVASLDSGDDPAASEGEGVLEVSFFSCLTFLRMADCTDPAILALSPSFPFAAYSGCREPRPSVFRSSSSSSNLFCRVRQLAI